MRPLELKVRHYLLVVKKKGGGGGKNIEDFHDFQKIDLCTVSLLRINIKGL